MSGLRKIYLGLAVLGAILPMVPLIGWLSVHGFSLAALLDAWRASPASRALLWDLLVSGLALCVWIIAETRVRKNWIALLAIPATFFIGVSCGLPLYLFLRTRPVT